MPNVSATIQQSSLVANRQTSWHNDRPYYTFHVYTHLFLRKNTT